MPKSLNDIISPSRRKTSMGDIQAPAPEAPRMTPSRPQRAPRTDRPRRFPYLIVIVALIAVAACFVLLMFFSKSKVAIVPTTFSGPVQAQFTATPSVGDLPYERIVVEKTAAQSVSAETTEEATDSARGTLVVSNTS